MTHPDRSSREAAADRGIYGISVAAELVGTGVQNLRAYEAKGLVAPDRTPGGTRLYSRDDIVRLRRIADLLDGGLNLAGVAMVLPLEDANAVLQQENSRLRADRATPPTPRRGRGARRPPP